MAEDGAMPQADGCCESLDPQISSATSVKDLVEKIEVAWLKGGYPGIYQVDPSVTAAVISGSCKEFFRRHPGEGIMPRINVDPLINTIFIYFERL